MSRALSGGNDVDKADCEDGGDGMGLDCGVVIELTLSWEQRQERESC